jgi:hypothetical protein
LFAPSSLAAIAQDKGKSTIKKWQSGGSYSAIAQYPTKMDRMLELLELRYHAKGYMGILYGYSG